MVRFVSPKENEHCVLVDGDKGEILDGAEGVPVKLCERALRLCSGARGEKLHIAEALEIVKE